MQRLEVSRAVRRLYTSLGATGLTVIKQGTCNVIVLCQFSIKCYKLKVVTAKYTLSIQLKKHSIPEYVSMHIFLCSNVKNSLVKFFLSIFDTPYITQNIMIQVLRCIKALEYCR